MQVFGDWWPGYSAIYVLIFLVLLIAGVVILGVLYGQTTAQLQSLKSTVSTINVGAPQKNYYKNMKNSSAVVNAFNQSGARMLFIGDNMMTGASSSNTYDSRISSLGNQLADLNYCVQDRPTTAQNFFGYESSILDKRVVFSNAWGVDSSPLYGIGGHLMVSKVNTGTITFTPDTIIPYSQTEIYALNTSAAFTVKVGTNAAVTVTPSSLTPIAGNLVKQVINNNNSISAPPVILITTTGATNSVPVQLFGVSCRSNGFYEVINCGIDTTSSQIINSTTPSALMGAGLSALAPNLVVIDIGAMDFQSSSQATYVQNMQNLFAYLSSRSIPFFVITPPWQQSSDQGTQTAFVTALKSAMDASSIPYLDFQSEMVNLSTQQNLGMSRIESDQMTFLGALKCAQDLMVALSGNAPQ